jgi:hypothetical protein
VKVLRSIILWWKTGWVILILCSSWYVLVIVSRIIIIWKIHLIHDSRIAC